MIHQPDTLPDEANEPATSSLMVSWQAARAAAVLRDTRISICRAADIRITTQAALRRTRHLEDAVREIERASRNALRQWYGDA